MRWLVLLALAQNLNVTPIEVRQNGVRVPQRVVQRQYVIDCGTNVNCGVDAGVMYLSAAGGTGGKVAEAYAADASITAQYLPITCAAGDFITCSGSACSCATPAGGPGGSTYDGGKIVSAYTSDASFWAVSAYTSDASYLSLTTLSGVADTAFSADASYRSSVAYTADASYSSVVSGSATTAGTAGVAFSADASYWSALSYTADASYSSVIAGSATAATVANVAFSTDASYWSALAYTADASYTAQQLAADPTACPATQYVSDITAAGVLTCSTPAGGPGGKVAEAYAADASISAMVFDHTPTGCAAGQYANAISAAGNLTCATPAGSGSGPNTGQFYVYFGDGTVSTYRSLTTVVSAAWASNSSSIVMSPACWVADGGVTSEECGLVQPECNVVAVTPATSFSVACVSEVGGFGNYTMSYSGL